MEADATDSVACLKCNISIQPATAKKNGGLCMPCRREKGTQRIKRGAAWMFIGNALAFGAVFASLLTDADKKPPIGVILAPAVVILLLLGASSYIVWSYRKYTIRSRILLITWAILGLTLGLIGLLGATAYLIEGFRSEGAITGFVSMLTTALVSLPTVFFEIAAFFEINRMLKKQKAVDLI